MESRQFRVVRESLPPNYLVPDYVDVGAVVLAMGNHLIDSTGPGFKKQSFTRSWICGVYARKVIFHEAMVTRTCLLSNPDGCRPLKASTPVAVAGFCRTKYCVRHNGSTGEDSVSMEAFAHRDASHRRRFRPRDRPFDCWYGLQGPSTCASWCRCFRPIG